MMGQFVYGWSQKRALLNQQMNLTQFLLDTLRKSTLSNFIHLQRMSWHQGLMTWQYESGIWQLRKKELYCMDTQTRYICSCNWINSLLQFYILCLVLVGLQFESVQKIGRSNTATLISDFCHLSVLCPGYHVWLGKKFLFQNSLWTVMFSFVTKWCI